jgi:uncharacterized protein GlcG (DUF336 family)
MMRTVLVASVAMLSALSVSTRANAAAGPAALVTQRVLSIELALEATKAAITACSAQGYSIAVAVVDRGGTLKLLAASPDVSPISVELAQRKARTGALFKARSAEIGQRFQAQPGFGQTMNNVDPRLSGAGGAVPIKAGEEVLGAMGISGAPGGEQDEACVNAGLAAIADSLR